MRRILPYLGTAVLLTAAAFSTKHALQTQQGLNKDVLLSSVESTDAGLDPLTARILPEVDE